MCILSLPVVFVQSLDKHWLPEGVPGIIIIVTFLRVLFWLLLHCRFNYKPICNHSVDYGFGHILFKRMLLNSLRPSDAYMRQKLTIIGSDNGLSPGRRQVII